MHASHARSNVFPGWALRLLCSAASLTALLLCGCVLGTSSNDPNTVHLSLQGSVFGGQQPVNMATIQLYTVGTTANGSASTPLISATVTTNARGGFHITGDYSCTNATQVYIVATGGDSGGGANSDIGLATALGPCSGLTSSTFISINELTTVAAAYALAPFEGSAFTSIGSSSTYATGLADAFAASNVLVSSGSGLVGAAAPAGITVPAAELNTLGNILASCINSSGPSSPGCTQLFNVTGATNTFDAVFYIAKNPGATAVINLFALSSGTSPFQPSFTTTPRDFTIAVKYTGTELQTPWGIAIDASGNAFVTNQTGNSVTAAPPLSSSFATATNTGSIGNATLSGPRGIAIDTNGYIWVANTGGFNVVEFTQLGSVSNNVANFGSDASKSVTFTGGAGNAPVAVATDNQGDAYTVSPGSNTVTQITSNGAVNGAYTYSSFSAPAAIGFSSHSTLAVGTSAGQICTLPFSGGTPTCTTQGSAGAITAVSYNTSGSSAGYTTNITNGSNTDGAYGPAIGSGPYTGGGIATPTAIVFDSVGNAFIANATSISQEFSSGTFHTAISPSTGYGTVNTPRGIAVDGSGNIWTANSGDNSLSIFIGLAAPTLTPIAANLH